MSTEFLSSWTFITHYVRSKVLSKHPPAHAPSIGCSLWLRCGWTGSTELICGWVVSRKVVKEEELFPHYLPSSGILVSR
jgi:hypothetical protein